MDLLTVDMSNLDAGVWYTLSQWSNNTSEGLIDSALVGEASGSEVLADLGSADPNNPINRWQFVPLDGTYYNLRNNVTGPDNYLIATQINPGVVAQVTMGNKSQDGSASWTVSSWNDSTDTYYITNQKCGSAMQMVVVHQGAMLVIYPENVSGTIGSDQRWDIKSIGPIHWQEYSVTALPSSSIRPSTSTTIGSVTTPASASTSASTSAAGTASASTTFTTASASITSYNTISTSPSPTPTPTTNTTGPAVGGAVGGILVLLILGFLAWYFRRKGYTRINKSLHISDEAGRTSSGQEKALGYYAVTEYRSPDDVQAPGPYEAHGKPVHPELDGVARHEMGQEGVFRHELDSSPRAVTEKAGGGREMEKTGFGTSELKKVGAETSEVGTTSLGTTEVGTSTKDSSTIVNVESGHEDRKEPDNT